MYQRMCLFYVISVGFYFGWTESFQITSQTSQDASTPTRAFSIQKPNPDNPLSFFRIRGNVVQEIFCPTGYEFNSHHLICVKNNTRTKTTTSLRKARIGSVGSIQFNSDLGEGRWPNPDSCSSFLLCNGVGMCWTMACPANTLFNADTKNCDYPSEANCCEYRAKNPDRLVQ